MPRKLSKPPEKSVVMLVDDMQAMRMLTRSALKHMGFKKFVECANGVEAIKRLKLMNVDLVVCDWDMPEMNGLELLHEVRADDRLKSLPFMMLTANSSADLIHECISAGVDSYMVKPYQPIALCKRINTLLKEPLAKIA